MERWFGTALLRSARRTAAQHKEPGGNDNMGASQVLQSRCMLVRVEHGSQSRVPQLQGRCHESHSCALWFALQHRGSGSL